MGLHVAALLRAYIWGRAFLGRSTLHVTAGIWGIWGRMAHAHGGWWARAVALWVCPGARCAVRPLGAPFTF
jgi:hypothetical protein